MPKEYIVQPGDCIDSIAMSKHVPADRIWNLPANQELKSKRKNPSVLLANDKVMVPEPDGTWVEGKASNKKHVFRLLPRTREYRIRGLLAGTAQELDCKVTIDGKDAVLRKSGEWLVCDIPLNAAKATINIKDWGDYQVDLGYLDPLDTPAGEEQRLRDMGYVAALPEDMEANRENARLLFEKSQGVKPDGVAKLLGDLAGDPA